MMKEEHKFEKEKMCIPINEREHKVIVFNVCQECGFEYELTGLTKKEINKIGKTTKKSLGVRRHG